MGMYDSFFFDEGVLPDNRELPTCEFQTKCLACNLDNYSVNKSGEVTRRFYDYEKKEMRIDEEPINDCAFVCSLTTYDKIKKISPFQEYKIMILNSKIIFVKKLREEGYD